jgi:hypothetical protein
MTGALEPIGSNPLDAVREGMHVVDAAGQDVGRVELVRMGDPEAATTAGNEERATGPFARVAEAFGGHGEPDVPEPLRSRLVRSGFLKVSGGHLLAHDRYVPAERVGGVANDRVQLTVRREDLVNEV